MRGWWCPRNAAARDGQRLWRRGARRRATRRPGSARSARPSHARPRTCRCSPHPQPPTLLPAPAPAPAPAPPCSAARRAIGPNITGVAAAARLQPARLKQLLTSDGDLGYAPVSGALLYACRGLALDGKLGLTGLSNASAPAGGSGPPRGGAAVPIAAAGTASAAPGGPDPPDPSMAFRLHSRPGAPKKILLDFDGGAGAGFCGSGVLRTKRSERGRRPAVAAARQRLHPQGHKSPARPPKPPAPLNPQTRRPQTPSSPRPRDRGQPVEHRPRRGLHPHAALQRRRQPRLFDRRASKHHNDVARGGGGLLALGGAGRGVGALEGGAAAPDLSPCAGPSASPETARPAPAPAPAAPQVDVTTEDDGSSLENVGVRVAIGGSSNNVMGDGSYGGIAFGAPAGGGLGPGACAGRPGDQECGAGRRQAARAGAAGARPACRTPCCLMPSTTPNPPFPSPAVYSFGWSRYDPAFVFPDNLGASNKAIAEAISHEVRARGRGGGVRGPASPKQAAACSAAGRAPPAPQPSRAVAPARPKGRPPLWAAPRRRVLPKRNGQPLLQGTRQLGADHGGERARAASSRGLFCEGAVATASHYNPPPPPHPPAPAAAGRQVPYWSASEWGAGVSLPGAGKAISGLPCLITPTHRPSILATPHRTAPPTSPPAPPPRHPRHPPQSHSGPRGNTPMRARPRTTPPSSPPSSRPAPTTTAARPAPRPSSRQRRCRRTPSAARRPRQARSRRQGTTTGLRSPPTPACCASRSRSRPMRPRSTGHSTCGQTPTCPSASSTPPARRSRPPTRAPACCGAACPRACRPWGFTTFPSPAPATPPGLRRVTAVTPPTARSVSTGCSSSS
jgi:hypothetical protein